MRPIALILLGWLSVVTSSTAVTNEEGQSVLINAAEFATTIPPADDQKTVYVDAFKLDVIPVSNARFLKFTQDFPEWRRDHVSKLFADENYLSHWPDSNSVSAAQGQNPVTRVSWFAATAFCESRGGRLPRWYEWERVAAADTKTADARDDPLWRQQILNWYARSSTNNVLPNVGSSNANFYGVKDIHAVVWEWVEDYNSLLVGSDNREQGGADKLKFCGAGAVNMEQKENYATLMRIALLSSLEAHYTTRNLGFRCAYDT